MRSRTMGTKMAGGSKELGIPVSNGFCLLFFDDELWQNQRTEGFSLVAAVGADSSGARATVFDSVL